MINLQREYGKIQCSIFSCISGSMCGWEEMMVKDYYIAVLHASSRHFRVPRHIQAHINEVYERVGNLN
jgi:hypothetical protein